MKYVRRLSGAFVVMSVIVLIALSMGRVSVVEPVRENQVDTRSGVISNKPVTAPINTIEDQAAEAEAESEAPRRVALPMLPEEEGLILPEGPITIPTPSARSMHRTSVCRADSIAAAG